ncbi:Hsp20/alpha crystallin family protein [Salinispira pacifica]|uniref:Heat shock protein Hsp20 n=1 Tax=Salinispira pacifica TaxID=1307761 RepID=V5WLX9_9SPIO|nr:Hsp20/alpha crystallin family protein [Salinispira pacifica]AHC16648.1 heat shock protein Hsp20 [Salinispira pacifica]
MNTVVRYRNGRGLANQMDELFNSVFYATPEQRMRKPAVDVREEDDRYIVEAELPGMSDADIDITIDDGKLKIENRKQEPEDEQKATQSEATYLLKERREMNFSRSFGLPRDVDQEQISANFTNGLLTLTLPKAEEAKPRQIKIS